MKRPGVRRLFSMSLRRRDRWESEVEEEILTHLASRAERLVAQGMSPAEAKDEAIRRFGSLDEGRERMIEAASHREDSMRRKETLGELRQDIAFASRTLSRNKGWAAVAVITLALGIGATTSVWSVASTLLLHPLSYPGSNRVVNVNLMPATGNSTGVDVAITAKAPLIRAWRRDAKSIEAIEPYALSSKPIGSAGHETNVVVVRVLPSFASFAGERPILGRNFNADDIARRERIAVLGEGLWRTEFGGVSSVLGQTVIVGGEPLRVVGVMPASLKTPRIGAAPTGVWVPLDLSNDSSAYRSVARLRPGATPELAERELDSIAARSKVDAQGGTFPFRAVLTAPGQAVSFRQSLILLTGAVLLVLLVAAANVAHLLLVRAIGRQREVAIRSALGASRARLARQMMTETFVLTAVGCAIGAGIAQLAVTLLVKFRPSTLPELQLAHIDLPAMALVISISLVCAVGFSALSATAISARGSSNALRSGIVAMFSRAGERFRSALVVTEMAMSAMLLVGAALLVRTVVELQRTDLGFDPKNLHVVIAELPKTRYPSTESRHAAMRDLAAAMRAIPGVTAVTISDALPSYRNFSIGTLQVEGTPLPPNPPTSFIDVGRISSSYFRTLGATLVEGRPANDSSTGLREIVINEGFAKKQWKPGEAIGKRVRVFYPGGENNWMTIVGVVRDISTDGPVGDKAAPFLYTSLRDADAPGIVYRTDGRGATLGQVLAAAQSTLPGAHIRQQSTEEILDRAFAPSRFIMILMAGFTALAVILAAVGLYGMMAYAVAQRTREIGIRMALGATRETIARGVVGRGALLGATGAALGLLLAVWGTRVIEGSLYGVSRLDTASFAFGGIGLVAIAIVASLIPMRRAVAVDPIIAIRAD